MLNGFPSAVFIKKKKECFWSCANPSVSKVWIKLFHLESFASDPFLWCLIIISPAWLYLSFCRGHQLMGDMWALEQLDRRTKWEKLGQEVCVCGTVCSRVCEFIVETIDSVVGFFFWATDSSDVVLLVCKDKDILWQGINAIVRLEWEWKLQGLKMEEWFEIADHWPWGGFLRTANRKRAPLPSIKHGSLRLRGFVCDLRPAGRGSARIGRDYTVNAVLK